MFTRIVYVCVYTQAYAYVYYPFSSLGRKERRKRGRDGSRDRGRERKRRERKKEKRKEGKE